MTQSQIRIEKIKSKILPVLKQAGVKKSSLFGSYVRGEETKSSDSDILVEIPAGMSLFEFVDLQLKLEDILESIKRIDEYTQNITEEDFYGNVSIQDAVVRRFEIIGEAVKHIPQFSYGQTPICFKC